MKEDLKLSHRDGMLIAELLTDIDHHTAKNMRDRIDLRLFETGERILVIDFSRVGFMDSSGLGLILGRAEKARAIGSQVYICGLSPTLMKLVRLGGLEKIKNLTLVK